MDNRPNKNTLVRKNAQKISFLYLTRQLDGTYTNIVRMMQNISWQSHTTNEVLYGRVPKVSQTIAKRRLELAGHCIRHPEEIAHNLVLWEPTHGQQSAGGQNLDFINTLYKDTGLTTTQELRDTMNNRAVWRQFISSVRPAGRPK